LSLAFTLAIFCGSRNTPHVLCQLHAAAQFSLSYPSMPRLLTCEVFQYVAKGVQLDSMQNQDSILSSKDRTKNDSRVGPRLHVEDKALQGDGEVGRQ
jgi:hypothetical protein